MRQSYGGDDYSLISDDSYIKQKVIGYCIVLIRIKNESQHRTKNGHAFNENMHPDDNFDYWLYYSQREHSFCFNVFLSSH